MSHNHQGRWFYSRGESPEREPLGVRVLIVGSGDAGESTLAGVVRGRTGLALTALDAHYWQPGWQPTPTDLWRPRVGELVAQPEGVMDGNDTSALDLRVPSADTIVFLDLPRRVTIPRVLRRGLRWRAQVRPGMAPDCPERVTAEFLRWFWRFPSQGRRRLLTAIDTADAHARLVQLSNRREVRKWVASLATRPEEAGT